MSESERWRLRVVDPTDVLTGAAIVAAVVSEAGKKLVTPVAETLGLALSDLAGIYRFYQNQNLGKISQDGQKIGAINRRSRKRRFRKSYRYYRWRSVQSDEDLQQRWASLLEYTVASPGDSLPSFGQTLSQLSPEEARFLDRLMALVSEPKPQPEPDEFVPPHPKPDTAGREPVSRSALLNVFDPSIKSPYTGTWPARGTDMEHHVLRAESENRAKIDRAELLFQDFGATRDSYPRSTTRDRWLHGSSLPHRTHHGLTHLFGQEDCTPSQPESNFAPSMRSAHTA